MVIPLIEIGLFITIGHLIGLWPTLLGVVITAHIGSFIIRQQGLSLLLDFRRETARGTLPARQIAEGMMLAIAGALLLTPGYFTDSCGFLLLVPGLRLALYNTLKSRMTIVGRGYSAPNPARRDSIDLDDDEWRRDR